MPYQHDTYDRRIQLGASRRRRDDAEALHRAGRWVGAIYLAGYAIECSLKASICTYEHKNNFKETHMFKKDINRNTLHNLAFLLQEYPPLKRALTTDHNGTFRDAWHTITNAWQKDELRYWDKSGEEDSSERFITAVKIIHSFILRSIGEAP